MAVSGRRLLFCPLRSAAERHLPPAALLLSPYRTSASSSAEAAADEPGLHTSPPLPELPREPPACRLPVDDTTPRIAFFNRIFEGLLKAGRIDDALKVFERMPEKEIKPNAATFEILESTLCNDGELDRAPDLLQDMVDGSVIVPDEFRESVVDMFKNAERRGEIEQLFQEKPAPLRPLRRPRCRPHGKPRNQPVYASPQSPKPGFDIAFFNRLLEGLTMAGEIDDALQVYGRLMSEKEIKPDETTYEILVNALCKERELDRARDLLQDMVRSGVLVRAEFRESVVQIFKNAGGGEEIEHVFEEKPVLLTQGPRWEYRPRGSPQSKQGYVFKEAQNSYGHSRSQLGFGVGTPQLRQPKGGSQLRRPVVGTPRTLRPGLGAAQAPQPGFGGTRLMQPGTGAPQPPEPGFHISFFNTLLERLTKAGQTDDAVKVYERLISDKEIKLDATSYEILVNALCKEGELDRARELLRDMVKGSVVARAEFCESVVDIFKNAKRGEEIAQLFQEKPVPLPLRPRLEHRPHSAPHSQPGYALGQAQNSYMRFQSLPGYGVPQPRQPSVHSSPSPEPEGGTRVQQPDVQQPDSGAPHLLVPGLGTAQRPVLGTAPPMQLGTGSPQAPQPGFHIDFFNTLLERLTKSGQTNDAVKLYLRLKSDKEIRPDATTYEILVSALCKEGEFDLARDLLRDMVRGSVVVRAEFCQYVVDIFKNAKWGEEIEQLLQERSAHWPPQPRPEYLP